MKAIKQNLKRFIIMSVFSAIMILLPFNQAFSQKPGKKHIKGTVWFDINGNGNIDAGEAKIQGINVKVFKEGNLVGSEYTKKNGEYNIEYTGAGTYTVDYEISSVPSGLVATTTVPITINTNGNQNYENNNIGFYDDPTDCSITKPNGGGFFTTISSVVNNGSNYTIKLTVEHNGCPGPDCKELSHYSVEASPNTYSDVSVNIISGGMTYGNINMGPNLGGDPFQGFKIDGTHNIGDGDPGVFEITYTLTSLQNERTSAKAGPEPQLASFTAAEFQQVLDCMAPVNNPPVAVDDAFSTDMEVAVSGNLLTNDSDPDGNNISLNTTPVTPPAHGSVTLNADGTFTYTPTTAYVGTDTFVYEIFDDGTPSLTDQATVTITINSIDNPPVAVDDAFSTNMNQTLSGNIITNDSDPDSDNITVNTTPVTPPAHGTLTLNADGTFTYTPETDYTGTDTFVYEIYDDGTPSLTDQATVNITINAANNPPVAVDDAFSENMNQTISGNVLTNDSDPDNDNLTVNTTPVTPPEHGTLSLNANGTFTYTPETDYTGTDSFVYEISDDGTPSLTDQATVNITIFTPGGDDDGDGVPNGEDDYPDDGNRAFDNYYPAAGYGTLAYEDLWPGTGDYDFNDLVCDYRFKMVTNSSNKVVDIQGSFIVRAIGATFKNGFGFQLPNDNVANSDITVTGYDIQESYINLNANGTEAGQTNPTIIIYDNCFNILEHPGSGIGVNTTPSAPYVQPDTIVITMNITPDKYTLAEIDIPNFNPFIIVNKVRGKEIHLPDYPPTDLVDMSYFGTFHDDSNAATGKYYKTDNNLPWAINIYESFDYPKEKVDIINTYNHFVEWAESSGASYPDWYKDNSGYRNANNIYQIPSK